MEFGLRRDLAGLGNEAVAPPLAFLGAITLPLQSGSRDSDRPQSAGIPSWTDAELVSRYRATGNDDLFEALVNRHKDQVFRLVIAILGPAFEADAEDVCQEVFLQVYRRLPSFRMESRFGTWLYSVARHRAIDRKRTARFRMPHVSADHVQFHRSNRADAEAHDTAAEGARRLLVLGCMDELSDQARAALYLHYWLGCSTREIAESLGVRPGTVKSYLHRGRRNLERRLRRRGVTDAF